MVENNEYNRTPLITITSLLRKVSSYVVLKKGVCDFSNVVCFFGTSVYKKDHNFATKQQKPTLFRDPSTKEYFCPISA